MRASSASSSGRCVVHRSASLLLDRTGARDRKRATRIDTSRRAAGVVALATVIDGIPESIVIGLNLVDGEGVALATVIAIFLSNIPEALSSTRRHEARRA